VETNAADPEAGAAARPSPRSDVHAQPAWIAYGALALLALIWGASFLLIKVAVQDMSPSVLVLIRSASGALTMGAYLALTRRLPDRVSWRRHLPAFAWMAILSGVVPWTAINWGEIYISSGLTSILNATTPIWIALFAFWVTPQERPTSLNYAGILVGFAGTVILVGPDLARHGINATALGTFAVLLGAASYAAAGLYQRRKLAGVDPYQATLGQIALTAIIVLPLTLPTIGQTQIRPLSLGAALLLGTAGSAVAYVLYYYLLNALGATRASTVTYLLPVTAVVWGVLLLHETVTIPIVVGMVVIFTGIFLTSRRRTRPA
jgi:drug/metabolite transporter (DMT)-like permease